MQLSIDIDTLSQAQREHVSGFILTYPSASGKGVHVIVTNTSGTSAAVEFANKVATMPTAIADADNPSTGLTDAAEAFGDPVALAFNGGIPLPAGATAAPCTAGVGQSPIAQGVTQGTTASQPQNVPVMSAQTGLTAGAPSASVTPSSNPVLLDKAGLPWDGRIHASTKTQTVDGNWKKKKGVDAGLVTQVETELRQVMGASPNVQQTSPVQSAAPVQTQSPGPVYSGTNAPAQPMQNVAAGSVDPATAKAEYVALSGRVAAAMAAGKLTMPEINSICAKHGLPGLPLLVNRLDLVGLVAFDIDMLVATR